MMEILKAVQSLFTTPEPRYQSVMDSKQRLITKCEKLGLELGGNESNGRLAYLIDKELTRRFYIGPEAMFEEQFDHLIGVGFIDGVFELDEVLRPGYAHMDVFGGPFAFRLAAATCLYDLLKPRDTIHTTEERVSRIRELGVMLVGRDYYRSHPESPFEAITKLREVKKFYLSNMPRWEGYNRPDGVKLMDSYFSCWEFALDNETLALY